MPILAETLRWRISDGIKTKEKASFHQEKTLPESDILKLVDTMGVFHLETAYLGAPQTEGCLLWNDPDLNIDWKCPDPLLSAKDQKGEKFKDFISPFSM